MIELDKAETGFGYLIQAYKAGGPFMNMITILGLLALVIATLKIVSMVSKKEVTDTYLGLIKMAGSLAVAFGFFSQVVGIVQALEAIRAAADISPQIVMRGAIVSFYAPIWGLFVFIVSMLIYYVLKEIIKARQTK